MKIKKRIAALIASISECCYLFFGQALNVCGISDYLFVGCDDTNLFAVCQVRKDGLSLCHTGLDISKTI
jgi:hypothetical protein